MAEPSLTNDMTRHIRQQQTVRPTAHCSQKKPIYHWFVSNLSQTLSRCRSPAHLFSLPALSQSHHTDVQSTAAAPPPFLLCPLDAQHYFLHSCCCCGGSSSALVLQLLLWLLHPPLLLCPLDAQHYFLHSCCCCCCCGRALSAAAAVTGPAPVPVLHRLQCSDAR